MSQALPIPPNSNLDHFHTQAQELQQAESCTLPEAQLRIARDYGFAAWPNFADHITALADPRSPTAQFETAVDTIVTGDSTTLAQLLAANPELARARSTREHRSTLLHYVSANGVEDFRQKTPPNIVAIATLLLNAGSDVNAESNAYSGHDATLGLTATSCHPEAAGVQIALIDLLLAWGATIDEPGCGIVIGCLANGRGPAAEYLATRGARLDLEGAAGVGRLDIVQSLFTTPSDRKAIDGFGWACEFGRARVVEYLLERGLDPAAIVRPHGGTGLHWAAYSGHVDIVEMLLARNAPTHIEDKSFSGTPLNWALHARRTAPEGKNLAPYDEIIARLRPVSPPAA